MAKYAISQEGLDSLDTLSKQLTQIVNDIENACKTLYSRIEGLGADLGTYEKDILTCIRGVVVANQQGREGVAYLAGTAIPRLKAIIEEIINMGIGTSDGDESQPPENKLVLRRR